MEIKNFLSLVLVTSPLSASAAVIAVAGPGGDFLVSDNLVGGASDASYSGAMGGDDTNQLNSWGGNRSWGNDGASTSASWVFSGVDGVENAVYNVYVSWKNDGQANVSTAHYTGTDGFAAVDLDQSGGASALSGVVLNDGTRDVNFALLGQVSVADGNFTLTVDDSVTGSAANTFIFSDAVAIQKAVPEPTAFALLGLSLIPLLRRRR
ncbi:MAG: hypothetical protein QNK82_04390 [Akkermansiaceae bacterium]